MLYSIFSWISCNKINNDVLFVVPQPTLEISTSQSDVYLAGMSEQIRCSISFDESVDTAVAAQVTWQINGMDLSGTVRRRTLQPVLVGNTRYDSSLQFDTLSSVSDSGNYMCTATLYSVEATNYITNATGTVTYMFIVTGE